MDLRLQLSRNYNEKMDIIKKVEKKFLVEDRDVKPGQQIRVWVKFKEGDKEKIQPLEGVVISVRGSGTGKTFTLRRLFHGIGVERIFPLSSPAIDKIEILDERKVRRAKLYLRK